MRVSSSGRAAWVRADSFQISRARPSLAALTEIAREQGLDVDCAELVGARAGTRRSGHLVLACSCMGAGSLAATARTVYTSLRVRAGGRRSGGRRAPSRDGSRGRGGFGHAAALVSRSVYSKKIAVGDLHEVVTLLARATRLLRRIAAALHEDPLRVRREAQRRPARASGGAELESTSDSACVLDRSGRALCGRGSPCDLAGFAEQARGVARLERRDGGRITLLDPRGRSASTYPPSPDPIDEIWCHGAPCSCTIVEDELKCTRPREP
jgi:hypothetical protein